MASTTIPSLSQITALPGLLPPDGVVPNFDHPEGSIKGIVYVIQVICLAVVAITTTIRLYTKVMVMKSQGWEDYFHPDPSRYLHVSNPRHLMITLLNSGGRLGELTAGIVVANAVVLPRFFASVSPKISKLSSKLSYFGSSKLRSRSGSSKSGPQQSNPSQRRRSEPLEPQSKRNGFIELSDEGKGNDTFNTTVTLDLPVMRQITPPSPPPTLPPQDWAHVPLGLP
ncbi:MAG: hypothetical protein Q9160_004387 [Pyrenula sp. 1 TL-2023]